MPGDDATADRIAAALEAVGFLMLCRLIAPLGVGRAWRLARTVVRVLRERPSRAPGRPPVAWALDAAARRLPGDPTCLPRALAARAMFLRRRQATDLWLGVRRSAQGGVNAHAWIESGGSVLIGGPIDGFRRLAVSRGSRPTYRRPRPL